MAMKPIKVVDSFCGSGKTSWAVQMMNVEEGPWMFVTPYINEIKRVIDACPGFVQPEAINSYDSKSEDLKRKLLDRKNIAATHELFKRLDKAAVELIRDAGYRLVLDEVLDIVQEVEIKDSIPRLIKNGVIQIAEGVDENRRVKKVVAGTCDLNRYGDILKWAEMNRLVVVDNKLLFWLLPVQIFEAFNEVWNLTYLFQGSYQCSFYQMHGLDFEMFATVGSWKKGFRLVEYDPVAQEAELKKKLRNLITIYDGPLNAIGTARNAFSRNWYKRGGEEQRKLQRRLMDKALRKEMKAAARGIMYTCPQEKQWDVGGSRYGKKFVAAGTRATNDYSNKSTIAFMLNVFIKPEISAYFEDHGIYLDEDAFALSEMVQLIWRSRIREMKPIRLFMPSKRMRDLFKKWLNGEISNQQEEAA